MGWLIAGAAWTAGAFFAWALVRAGALADQRAEAVRRNLYREEQS